MKRRVFLSTVGLGTVSGLAGCSSSPESQEESDGSPGTDADGPTSTATDANDSPDGTEDVPLGPAPFEHPGTLDTTFVANGDYPTDETPADGFPPAFPDPPSRPDVDESAFATKGVNGESVTLVPIDVAVAWYRRAEARVVDARGLRQYERSHVYGSVLSTAQQESDGGGIEGWGTEDRILTYCGCPHHLSSLRAAGLQKAGYEHVYAIDEGFGEWSDRGYPMAGTAFGTETQGSVSEWTIEGAVDDHYAGEYAWAQADRQYEAAPIGSDGGFTLHLKFADVTSDTAVQVSTPAFTVTRPLGELASGVVEG